MINISNISSVEIIDNIYVKRDDLFCIAGICVGANPEKRLDKYVQMWRFCISNLQLIQANYKYSDKLSSIFVGNVELDPIYEAKARSYVRKGDLFWIIGRRNCL